MDAKFWANYVILAEKRGTPREVTLDLIEAKYGKELRDEVETVLRG